MPTDRSNYALVFLRTTADTEATLAGGLVTEASPLLNNDPIICRLNLALQREFEVTLLNAPFVNIDHWPRARRLLFQSFYYFACSRWEELRRGGYAVACSFYSRGVFPALLWSHVIDVSEFVEWGEEYLWLQRRQIERASAGLELGHCEVALDIPYSSDYGLEHALGASGIWIKDYRAPRVLLLAGIRSALESLLVCSNGVACVRLAARTPVTPCNAAHLPLVDPTPQIAFLRQVPFHRPVRSIVAQADATVLFNRATPDEIRDFILRSAIGPMRTFEAIDRLSSMSSEIVAIGTHKAVSALCREAQMQPHSITHIPAAVPHISAKLDRDSYGLH